MDPNTLIEYDAVSRLEGIPTGDSSFPTRSTTRFVLPSFDLWKAQLSQEVDFPTPRFAFMGRFDSINGQIVWQTNFLRHSQRLCNKLVMPQRPAPDQNEPSRFGTEETGREKQWGFIVRTL